MNGGTSEASDGTSPQWKEWPAHWLGPLPEMYEQKRWRDATDIAVAQFRQIFVWPLALALGGDTESAGRIPEQIDAACRRLAQHEIHGKRVWEEIDDRIEHLTTPPTPSDGTPPGEQRMKDERQYRYSEFVYFHDHLQKILFPPAASQERNAPFRIFRRLDVRKVALEFNSTTFGASIDRCNLYLFRTGAAILVLELGFGSDVGTGADVLQTRKMNLADVQTIIDRARRTYAPFFDDEDPQRVLDRFTWSTAQGALDDATAPDRLPAALEHVLRHRTSPMAAHWRAIVAPLQIRGYEDSRLGGAVWRHVVDERIPVMSFVSLTGASGHSGIAPPDVFPGQPHWATAQMRDLQLVSRGDWVRLCFADEPGTDPLPYAPEFLRKFEIDHCYDRFFASHATTSATRYMFGGYHMAVVGAGRDFVDTHILHHFRRHYFQMALIINMEFASMLVTSSRISAAVGALLARRSSGRAQADAAFRRELVDIERDFLELVHQFQFSGLSNQMQPTEMYAIWRRTLRLDDVLGELKHELNAATQFLLSNEQVRQASSAGLLSVIATIGVVLGLAFSALGMNVIFSPALTEWLKDPSTSSLVPVLREALPLGLTLLLVGLVASCVVWPLVAGLDDRLRRLIRGALLWIAAAGAIAALVGACFVRQ